MGLQSRTPLSMHTHGRFNRPRFYEAYGHTNSSTTIERNCHIPFKLSIPGSKHELTIITTYNIQRALLSARMLTVPGSFTNCTSHFISSLEGIEKQKISSARSSCPDACISAGRCRSSRHNDHRRSGLPCPGLAVKEASPCESNHPWVPHKILLAVCRQVSQKG